MNKMREQFEKWDYETFGEDGYEVNELGEYEDSIKQQCWMAWKASRENLVIQLPFVRATGGYYNEFEYYDVDEVKESMSYTGVKYE